MREVIRKIFTEYEKKNIEFITEFKQHLGDEYLKEIESLGVNLHFLQLKLDH